jgi:hypothetical protein
MVRGQHTLDVRGQRERVDPSLSVKLYGFPEAICRCAGVALLQSSE